MAPTWSPDQFDQGLCSQGTISTTSDGRLALLNAKAWLCE